MKKLLILFVAAFSTLSSTAQNYYEEPTLMQMEIYAEDYKASFYAPISKEDVLNYGIYMRVPKGEILDDYKIEEYLSELEESDELKAEEIYNFRTIIILTYSGVSLKKTYYIASNKQGIIYQNKLYKHHPKLYETIYSQFLPSFYPLDFISDEELESRKR